ncbi:MAG TPA: hypothetical protein VMI74_04945 [Burkholderiales bacterium]|nr:hypothetical protein [Burkholderiales bacterium]
MRSAVGAFAFLAAHLIVSKALAAETQIVVNAVPLTAETVRKLQRIYPVPIRPGRYWYDGISGAWGFEGDGIAGQMLPGLALGGRLRADASRGTSGIFINGRQITMSERAYLERTCRTRTVPGRYWVNARGVGGFEGGPAWFDLSRCGQPQRSSGGSSTRTFCDPDGSCRSSGLWGSILTTPR